ncbi:MAG: hypothetical protein H5T69_15170 [Chloroflexi bacterium]|nr:hypothetical protein [Chloroflexota bacterium]
MRRILFILLILCAFLGMAAPSVQAQPRTPEAAILLTNDRVFTGFLPGNKAGSFAYYKVAYPGGNVPVRIRVSYIPGDPVFLSAFGFQVYGVNGFLLGKGQPITTPSTKELVIKDKLAATLLVQIYNYDWKVGMQYRIWVSGLPEAKPLATIIAAPKPTPAATPIPASGAGTKESPFLLPVGKTLAGQLTGDRAGSFHYYALSATAGQAAAVSLSFAPDPPGTATGIGFTIYGPMGVVAQSARTAQAGERVAHLVARSTGNYLVQVYNYIPGLTVDYRILLSR